ncbi:hypothetical protein [Streptomyces sp. NPDC059378]|uniref:hypothetical protein n=1 Tax=Streptomyces sp. NPDC059378 TaxID=3346815 RepID=UPI0036938933
MRRASGSGGGAVAAAVLLLSGCGGGAARGSGEPTAAPVRDSGPVCVGAAPAAGGLHVLRGDGFRLPGGGGVRYAAAHADGTTRTAVLGDGARYEAGRTQQTVRAGQRINVSGHAYTVRQICSYRVVLEPAAARDRAAAAAAPGSPRPVGGEADDGFCFTTNPAVLATASKGFPARGDTMTVLDNGGVWRFPTGLSITVSYVDTKTRTARLRGDCAAVPVADYDNVRDGDTVEFAGVLFEVSGLTEQAVRLKRTSA